MTSRPHRLSMAKRTAHGTRLCSPTTSPAPNAARPHTALRRDVCARHRNSGGSWLAEEGTVQGWLGMCIDTKTYNLPQHITRTPYNTCSCHSPVDVVVNIAGQRRKPKEHSVFLQMFSNISPTFLRVHHTRPLINHSFSSIVRSFFSFWQPECTPSTTPTPTPNAWHPSRFHSRHVSRSLRSPTLFTRLDKKGTPPRPSPMPTHPMHLVMHHRMHHPPRFTSPPVSVRECSIWSINW